MLDIDIKEKMKDMEKEDKPKKGFFPAPEVEKDAKELISRFHPHLLDAKISYIFRDGKWEKDCRPVMGDVKLMSPYHRVLTGLDFGIIVNYRLWLSITSRKQHQAIIDHLLAYCGYTEDKNGDRKWKKVVPTIAEFPEVVARHGAYNETVVELADSLAEFEKGEEA